MKKEWIKKTIKIALNILAITFIIFVIFIFLAIFAMQDRAKEPVRIENTDTINKI